MRAKPSSHAESWKVHCTVYRCPWGKLHGEVTKGNRSAAIALAQVHQEHTNHTVDVIGVITLTFVGMAEIEQEVEKVRV